MKYVLNLIKKNNNVNVKEFKYVKFNLKFDTKYSRRILLWDGDFSMGNGDGTMGMVYGINGKLKPFKNFTSKSISRVLRHILPSVVL